MRGPSAPIPERDPAEEPLDEVTALRAELAAHRLEGAAFAEVGHDLRNLIGGLIGLSALLLDTQLTPEQRDYVRRMRGISDALVAVVNNVVDWRRAEAGKLTLDRVDLDLRRLIEEVVEVSAERARGRGVKLVADVAADVPRLRGDPARLRQVLTSLVSNALERTDRGEVALHAGVEEVSSTGVLIRIEVRDTGAGIGPEAQARIFDPGEAGGGIGLALSQKIVEAMGGDIAMISAPDEGNTFRVTVMLDEAAACPARSPEEAPPAEGRPRVLLVEDNAVNQRVARLMIEKRGYHVDVAGDGYEAVEATGRAAYAAVLMDCQMPRFDGYSATGEIRARDAGGPRVPIIAMTANAGPGARDRCLAAGMDDYIAKPVTSDALDEVLRRWVPGAPAAPPRAPRKAISPIDLGMLRQLRATQGAGEPDIVAEVIALFLRDAPLHVAAIRDAAAGGDPTAALRAAHTLKGSAGHLGAKALAAVCARFEEKVRSGVAFDPTFEIGAIADELERVRAALVEEPRSRRGGSPPA